MNKSKQMKALALAVVAMMVLVSAAAMVPADGAATAKPIPTGENYGYILETDSSNITVVSVTVNRTVQTTKGLTQWSYDSNGLGPFNTFYAAVNLADYTVSGAPSEFGTETPLSTKAGEIAYVLDPNNLKQTLGNGTTITQGKYNIMLVIPTVYWYSDNSDTGNNKLYMSNKPGYFSGTVSSDNMKPWAHTIKLADNTTVTKDHLMIGVYEGYVDGSNRLTSQSGVIPTASKNIAAFRTNALNNEVAEGSYYGLWNFYQYTLYKMMAFTVMGSMDSQHAAGLGEGNVWGKTATSGTDAQKTALAASMTGDGDTKGTNESQGWYGHKTDYSSQQTAGKNMNNQYSKVFIENSWGSVTEFVDDVWFSERSMMVGNNDPSLLSDRATTQSNMGLDSTMQSAPTSAVSVTTDGMITVSSKVSQTWGVPTLSTSSSANGTLQNDKVWSNTGSRCLHVGGTWSNGAYAGVGYFGAGSSLDYSNYTFGARLAYLTSAASADYAIRYNVGTGGAVDGPAGGKYGEQVDLTVTPATGYSLATLTYTIGTGNPVDIKDSKAFTILESTEATEVTVTATFSKNSYAVTLQKSVDSGSVPGDFTPNTMSAREYDSPITTNQSARTVTVGDATVTAPSAEGYTFVKWTYRAGTGEAQDITAASKMPASEITLIANYTINKHNVTLTVSPSGYGTLNVYSMTDVPYGSSITQNNATITINGTLVTATAAEGMLFSSWTVPGSATTMPDNDLAITAVFIADPAQYQVIGSATGGSLLFQGMTTGHTEYMSAGETVQVTLTPDSGKMLQTISAAYSGGSVPMAKSGDYYQFVMPSGATTVTAVFVETGSSIQVTFVDTNAQKSVIIDVKAGEHIMLPTATAPANKVLGGWYSAETGGELYGVAGQYYKPAGDVTMYSRYADSPSGPTMGSFSVTVSSGSHLDVSYSGSIIGGSFGFLSIVPQKNYGYDAPTVVNGTLSRISDDYYIINPAPNLESGSEISITVSETHLDPSGFSEFYVAGVIGDSAGVKVVMESKDNGGLQAGTVSLEGTYVSVISGVRTYFIINEDSYTATASEIAGGDLEFSANFTLTQSDNSPQKYIYWAYATFTSEEGTAVDTVGVLAPARYV